MLAWLKLDLIFLSFFKKIGHKSHCVAQAGLELLGLSGHPALASMPGVYPCAKLRMNCEDEFWYSRLLSWLQLTSLERGACASIYMWV